MATHDKTMADSAPQWMSRDKLDRLVETLKSAGFTVVGPQVDQGAVVYAELGSVDDLPRGWSDHQAAGAYRLRKSENDAYFEFNVGPHSWKQFLFPPRLVVERAQRNNEQWEFRPPAPEPTRYALLGVRACELAAIRIQDRVMMEGSYVDPEYAARRKSALIIAVNCTVASSTCFCTSMDTGPRCRADFDLALTETPNGFVVEIGSPAGREIAATMSLTEASDDALIEADALRQRAVQQMTKRFDTHDIRDLLIGNLDHPHWDQVAERCLSCANCTMVCPTCFCSTVEDVADLEGTQVDRVRSWDSCFNLEFGYTAAGTVRNSTRNRYRQWLTHKLASWHDQFDSSGCVGCGRCIAWCPVGIDLTEEVSAIRQSIAETQAAPQRRMLPPDRPTPEACIVPNSDNGGDRDER